MKRSTFHGKTTVQHQPLGHRTIGAGKRLGAATALDSAEVLASHFPVLARYLGESRIRALALDIYGAKVVSHPFNGARLKKFLAELSGAERFKLHPEIAELALLELSFRNALEANNGALPLKLDTHGLERRKLRLHPSVQCLVFTQNTTSIWSALKCEETPPRPFKLDAPQHVLVWRQNGLARFRILGVDEAKALARFNTRSPNTSSYFRGWLDAGLVVESAK